MLAKWNKQGRVTILNAAGFLAVNELRHDAYEKLLGAGFTPAEATAILDTPVVPAVWRSNWAAAAASQLAAHAAALGTVASAEDVADVRKSQETLQASVAELQGELASDRQASELAAAEAALRVRFEEMMAVMRIHKHDGPRVEQTVWRHLMSSDEPVVARVLELRAG